MDIHSEMPGPHTRHSTIFVSDLQSPINVKWSASLSFGPRIENMCPSAEALKVRNIHRAADTLDLLKLATRRASRCLRHWTFRSYSDKPKSRCWIRLNFEGFIFACVWRLWVFAQTLRQWVLLLRLKWCVFDNWNEEQFASIFSKKQQTWRKRQVRKYTAWCRIPTKNGWLQGSRVASFDILTQAITTRPPPK